MGPAIKWGAILAVAVALVSLVMIASGLHMNPLIYGIGVIVVFMGLNIVAVVMALRATADEKGYLGQLGSGAVLGLVGGVLSFAFSLLITTVIFPDAIPQMIEASLEFYGQAGLTEEQLVATEEQLRQTTPMAGAVQGLIGTFCTSVIVAAITAIFVRRK